MTNEIKGILPVVHMPYNPDETIHLPTLQREVDYLFETGAHGLCLALVSDLLRLTPEERITLPAHLVEWAADRGPVIINVGAESTLQASHYAHAAADAGAAALMAIPPLTQAMPESELRTYFEVILDAVDIPLMVQDASSYVGAPMSLEFQASLFDDHGDRILFKPEATPLGPCLSGLRDLTAGKARHFEGSGGILLIDSFRRGIAGTIPGVELLHGIVPLWHALHAGDNARAYALHAPISAIAMLQLQGGLDGFIAIERHIMHRRGLFPTTTNRSPFSFTLDSETAVEVDRILDNLEALLTDAG